MATHKTEHKMYLTLQDVADLAGVSKPAVANWKKRDLDFPEPVVSASSERVPRFSYEAIVTWLLANRKVTKESLKNQASGIAFKALVSALNKLGYTHDAAFAGLALAYFAGKEVSFHGVKNPVGDLDQLTQALGLKQQTLETVLRLFSRLSDESLFELTELTEAVLKHRSPQQLVEDLIDHVAQRNYSGGVAGAELIGKNDSLPQMAGALAGIQESLASIYEPFVGYSSTLLAVAKATEATEIYASDIDAYSMAFTELRLKLHGIEADLQINDVFSNDIFSGVKADFAFIEGPWGAQKGADLKPDFSGRAVVELDNLPKAFSSEALTLMDTVSHLSEGGRGYVLTPLAIASHKRFERFRNAFIAQGCVEAIVELPGGTAKNTQIPLLLWVLRAPRQLVDPVILVDAGNQAGELVEAVVQAVVDISEGSLPQNLPACSLSLAEALAEGEYAWLPSVAMNVVPTTAEIEAKLTSTRESIKSKLSKLTAAEADDTFEPIKVSIEESPMTNLANLKEWAVKVPTLREAKDTQNSMVAETKSVFRILPSIPGRMKTDDEQIGKDQPILAPGDLVVWAMNGLRAVVVPDDSYEYVVKSPAQVFRLNQSVWNPHYLAAMISYQTPYAEAGSAMNRVRLQDVSVRQLPLAQQGALVQQFTQLEHIQRSAEQLTKELSDFKNILADLSLAD